VTATNDSTLDTSIPTAPLESILCKEALQSRPSRPPDHEKENRALVKLMGALADSPSTIFQTLADTILEITHCDSAGLSLLTKDGKTPHVEGQRFYWPAIAGMWNPHVGGGTPRNFGPCGDVLDRNTTMLFTHWERRYPYLSSAVPFAEEGLLVPFYVEGKAVGTIWGIMHSDRRKFDAEDDRIMASLGKFASSAYEAVMHIKDLKRTAELAAANAKLQLQVGLLQHLPVSAWTLKPDGTPDFVNQVWLEFAGQTLDFVRSHPEAWMTAVHPEDRETAAKCFWEGVRSGQGFAFETRSLRAQDGIYRWHLQQAVVLRDAEGKILKFVGTTTDIDDQKRVEQELLAVRDELAAELTAMTRLHALSTHLLEISEFQPLLEEVLDATIALQKADFGNIQLFNPETKALEIVAQRGFQQDFLEYFRNVRDTGAACGRAMELRERVIIEDVETDPAFAPHRHIAAISGFRAVQSTPLFSRSGEFLGMLSTHFRRPHRPLPRDLGFTDLCAAHAAEIIDQKRLDEARRQAEQALDRTQAKLTHVARVMTLGTMTASIAHELNQPLSGIITNASTCQRMLGTVPPNIDGALETARRTIRDANRASEVITRLRALFSRKETATESVDLNEAMREVIALSLSGLQRNGIVVQADLADDLPPVTGDRIQLQQVILNLLRNGSEAMSTVDDRPRRLIITTNRDEGDRVRLSVKDVGVGFEPQAAGRLFEDFYTTKDDGMGIGLSVSRFIIESHNGRLWAETNDGPGATFSFSIPYRREEGLTSDETSVATQMPSGRDAA
jgi:PAS domain S-box-containing protein